MTIVKNTDEIVNELNERGLYGLAEDLILNINVMDYEKRQLREALRTTLSNTIECRSDVGFNCEGMVCSKCPYDHEPVDSIIEYMLNGGNK